MEKLINIIKYEYGFNNKEAKNYIKNTPKETLKKIKQGFENNAKSSFYND